MNAPETENYIIDRNDKVMVTGSGGFIGHHVVTKLLEYGFTDIRCLVFSSASIPGVQALQRINPEANIEFFQGNLCSREYCESVVGGVKVILHLAAGADGKSYAGSFMKSVISTRNLIEASLKTNELVRFVSMGSFASYSNVHMKHNDLLDETCPDVESGAPENNPYTFAKTEQDNLVKEYGKSHNLPWVIIRPGAVYGPGVKEWITSRVGIDTFGFFIHLGGKNSIPLAYVENCAEAVVLAGLKSGAEHNTFNIIDDDLPQSNEFLKLHKKNAKWFFSLPIPYPMFYFLSYLWEKFYAYSKGQVPLAFSRKRASIMWKGNTYSNNKAKTYLGWKPNVGYPEATERYFSFLRKRIAEENA